MTDSVYAQQPRTLILSIRVKPESLARIDELAKVDGMTRTEMARKLLAEGLAGWSTPARKLDAPSREKPRLERVQSGSHSFKPQKMNGLRCEECGGKAGEH